MEIGFHSSSAVEKRTVVVVDDDLLLSNTIGICLRSRGYEVSIFNRGVDAVKYFFENKADSIILDIRLPDYDGWFIARLLKKLDWAQKVPLIVMSVLEADRLRLAEVRPYAYVQKPFDMGHLLKKVEGSLEGSAAYVSRSDPRVSSSQKT